MKSQFAADFEAYMPTEFNGEPYGKSGRLSLANEASINVCVVFPAGVPPGPRPLNADLLQEAAGEPCILPGCLVNPTMNVKASDDLKNCIEQGAQTVKLMAALHRYRVDSTYVAATIEQATSLGIPATIHFGSPTSGCSPQYIESLARRHPDVTIIMDIGLSQMDGASCQIYKRKH